MDEIKEDAGYLGRIKEQYDSLSKSQKKIARYILEHKDQVVNYSITQMAQKLDTAPSTITRFCQALSYKGFSELKVYLEKNIATPVAETTLIAPTDSLGTILQKLNVMEQNVLQDTLRIQETKTIKAVADALLSAKHIFFFGQSGGYVSGLYGQQQFRRMNLVSTAVTGKTEMELCASAMEAGDVAIGIAYSGEVSSVIDALKAAKYNRATIVTITAIPNSSMAKLAHYKLLYSYNVPDDLQYNHVASMCELAILGSIEAEILRRPEQQQKIEKCKKAVLSSRNK